MYRSILAPLKPGFLRPLKCAPPIRVQPYSSQGGFTLQDFLNLEIPFPPKARKEYLSSTASTVAANPRALRGTFRTWNSFFEEVETFFTPHLDLRSDSLTYDSHLPNVIRQTRLSDENGVRDLASIVLEIPCAKVIHALNGISSKPQFRSSRASVNIGDADRVLTFDRPELHVKNNIYSPRVVFEEKTPWALPLRGIDIVREVNRNRHNNENRYLRAVHQLYGYMTFNHLKYGILTSVESTRILRRVHDSAHPDGLLECSPEIDITSKGMRSPLAAYAFIACRAYREGFMHLSLDPDLDFPTRSLVLQLADYERLLKPIPGLVFPKSPRQAVKKLRLFLRDVVGGGNHAYTTRASAFFDDPDEGKPIVLKIYDLYSPKATQRYHREIDMYHHLVSLQGTCVPEMYAGGHERGGGFGLIVLEDCGAEMDQTRFRTSKGQCKTALSEIHRLGVLHRDMAFRNITYKENDPSPVRIIDFGESTVDGNVATKNAKRLELRAIEKLCSRQDSS
ncbi:hypothetical protein TWF106_001512 [Orbilia oligospora]|uniref:Protein kinase domain-containing protein n=1 Tax=Orbilia oligospora TaxID=2813651 RepID=A0A7C8QB88_ORBOL|nr:hypothetical protein TWF106_001512 [Orbilia oligospora]KAF3228946.1 hypothetical protein TWF191_002059 [Orbilia oligospora]